MRSSAIRAFLCASVLVGLTSSSADSNAVTHPVEENGNETDQLHLQQSPKDNLIGDLSQDEEKHRRASSGSWCDRRQKHTHWPCYRNLRYGCSKKYCRRTWTTTSPYSHKWYDRHDIGYFKCKKHADCLKLWKSREAKSPGYIPCVNVGYWSWYCHQGLYYGCGAAACAINCECWRETGLVWFNEWSTRWKYTGIKCTKSNQHKVCNNYRINHGEK